ncbi:hypothetical protein TRFO_09226 [Tritrichomonas foetus]|uniref:Uncharacterized protein n=1 Tax=Tritrichomonas foetus TaxID=1144522 RepID=A0A1J4JHS6_9EUKA|nr:hypothetical protein TRFO_09226 [Tritrichomonas foetus]|eukprot:OHS97807.1 hypothetical protein TRFO_09226 [Tritrichomonas foetus]
MFVMIFMVCVSHTRPKAVQYDYNVYKDDEYDESNGYDNYYSNDEYNGNDELEIKEEEYNYNYDEDNDEENEFNDFHNNDYDDVNEDYVYDYDSINDDYDYDYKNDDYDYDYDYKNDADNHYYDYSQNDYDDDYDGNFYNDEYKDDYYNQQYEDYYGTDDGYEVDYYAQNTYHDHNNDKTMSIEKFMTNYFNDDYSSDDENEDIYDSNEADTLSIIFNQNRQFFMKYAPKSHFPRGLKRAILKRIKKYAKRETRKYVNKRQGNTVNVLIAAQLYEKYGFPALLLSGSLRSFDGRKNNNFKPLYLMNKKKDRRMK